MVSPSFGTFATLVHRGCREIIPFDTFATRVSRRCGKIIYPSVTFATPISRRCREIIPFDTFATPVSRGYKNLPILKALILTCLVGYQFGVKSNYFSWSSTSFLFFYVYPISLN